MPDVDRRRLFPLAVWIWGAAVLAALGGIPLAQGLKALAGAVREAGTGWLPAGPWLAGNMLRAGGSILAALLMVAVSAALGGRLLRLVTGANPAGVVRMTSPFAGYAAISFAVLGLAATGLCYPGVVAGLGILLLVLSGRGLTGFATRAWRAAGRHALDPALGGLLLIALLALPKLLVPEHDEDSLLYHLALPQQLLVRHRLPDLPGYWAWGFPLLADLPNVFAVGLGIDAAVRLTGLALASLGACACVRALAPELGGAWTVLLALVALLVPTGNWFLVTAKNDSTACGFLLAASAALVQGGGWRGTAWASFLAGCAVSAKLTLAPVVAAGTVLAVLRTAGRPWRRAPAWLAATALPLSPWIVRSWLQFADPVHPFGAAAFPRWFGIGGNGAAVRIELAGYLRGGGTPFMGLLDGVICLLGDGWPAVALLPVLAARSGPAARWVMLSAGTGVLLTGLMTPGGHAHLGRYVFPAVVFLNAAALAAVARAAATRGGRAGRLAGIAAATAVALVLVARVRPTVKWAVEDLAQQRRAWLAGRLDTEAYRRSLLGSWGLIQPVVADAARAAGGRVLVEGTKFLWGLPGPVVTADLGRSPVWEAVSDAGGPVRVAIRFRQSDIRWIAYDAEVASWDRAIPASHAWTRTALRAYADFARQRFVLVVATPFRDPGFGMHWVYAIAPRPHAPAPRVAQLPGTDTAFGPATMALMRGEGARALEGYAELHAIMPDVTATSAVLGDALVRAGRSREGYALLQVAAEDGLIKWR